MRKKSIILIISIVVLRTFSIFTITIFKNKFNDAKSNATKNTTMKKLEYSNILYDINGNPIDDLADNL